MEATERDFRSRSHYEDRGIARLAHRRIPLHRTNKEDCGESNQYFPFDYGGQAARQGCFNNLAVIYDLNLWLDSRLHQRICPKLITGIAGMRAIRHQCNG